MVDEVLDTGAQVEAPAVEQVQDAPQTQESTPVAEKMLPQSQVSKIAAREARAAAEKASERTRAEMQAQFDREKAELVQSHQPANPNSGTPTLGGMQQMTDQEFEQRVHQAAYKLSFQAQGERIENEFDSKMNAEMHADPEFADLYDALNIKAHPELVIWANGLDNSAQVVKELAKNPTKYSNVLMLSKSGSPRLAEMEMQKISTSIRLNEEAQKRPQAPAPLDQIKPSNIGADNGEMSVADYRKIFRG